MPIFRTERVALAVFRAARIGRDHLRHELGESGEELHIGVGAVILRVGLTRPLKGTGQVLQLAVDRLVEQERPSIDDHAQGPEDGLKRDFPFQVLVEIDPNLLDGAPQGGGNAGRQVAHIATGGDILLDEPEKCSKRRIAVPGLRIVNSHASVLDPVGNRGRFVECCRSSSPCGGGKSPVAGSPLPQSMPSACRTALGTVV
jgi:hypothetical protein